jgi:hypothetical protein
MNERTSMKALAEQILAADPAPQAAGDGAAG